MSDVAASVLARLKNRAKESGRSYQLCLQLFCQEEFLRRLEKSMYAEFDVKTVDFRECIPEDKRTREKIYQDGIHLNSLGHKIIAKFLIKKLMNFTK